MQPYLLPYLGYFQLMNDVDKFVIYDNIQFTKKGWIHRNRILSNGKDALFTLPIKKDSDYLNVNERYLSEAFEGEKKKVLRRIKESYRKAPYFDEVYPLIETIFNNRHNNLFDFIYFSICEVTKFIGIDVEIIKSSELDSELAKIKGQDKVLGICKALNGTHYINAIGGKELYDKDVFSGNNIKLHFLNPELKPYQQFKNTFVPGLSIVDVLMFNSVTELKVLLNNYSYE